MVNAVSRLSSLQEAGFLLDRESVFLALSRNEDAVEMQDEAATLMGDFSMSITVHFLRRHLHLIRGWPWTMVRVVGDGAIAKNCLLKFGRDTNIFNEIRGKLPLSAGLQRVYDRHVHQKSSVQALEHSFKDPTFPSQAWKTDFKKVQKDHAACAVPTVIIEEINGVSIIQIAECHGFVKGYLFTLQRSAHTTCNCFQGIGFNVFRPHSEEDGKFPDHTVLDQAMAMPDFTVHRFSYGWVRRSALQRVFDPTIFL